MPVRTSYRQGTPSWVDLSTTDQPAAKSFYGSLFEWEWEDSDMGGGQFYSMARSQGHYAAAVYQQGPEEAERRIPPHWNTYITVDDVDATVKKIAPAGGEVLMEPFDVYDSGRMAFVSDPTGAPVAFWQAKSHIGAGIVNEPGTMAWNELITDDVERASAFFKETLGVEILSQREPFPYSMALVDGDIVCGFMPKSPEMSHIPNGWALDFAVADCDSSAKKAESLGATVLAPPSDAPPGRFAVLRDPQGAVFSVLKLRQ